MKSTSSYTSTLPIHMLDQLNDFAQKLNLPKNQIIEQALQLYFDQLKQVEYIQSFQRAAKDEELHSLAEEGLDDYLDMNEKL